MKRTNQYNRLHREFLQNQLPIVHFLNYSQLAKESQVVFQLF